MHKENDTDSLVSRWSVSKVILITYLRKAQGIINQAPVIVVLMGGDGGLMMSIEQLRADIDISKLIFISLPFGSGNDMAQA